MLSDPTLVLVSSAPPSVGPSGTSCNFRKIAAGKMSCVDGLYSADQPAFLSVFQKKRKFGVNSVPSDFTVRGEVHVNIPPVAGLTQPDLPLTVDIRITSHAQYHTNSHMLQALNAALHVVLNNYSRLQAGEGI